MSCLYCGKRVSLVRKRSDPDFCGDDHRERYNARTRRSMEVLAEDEERMVVTRRLTHGFPLRANVPCHGTELDDLRASNTSNYHAAGIGLDGSSGTARLVRFSMVAGDREPPVTELFPVALGKSVSCRVRVPVSGNDFKIFPNDQPAGEWSDDRLPEGGIGFFSEPDDRARLYWVKVTQYYQGPVDDLYVPMAPLRSEIKREIRMGV